MLSNQSVIVKTKEKDLVMKKIELWGMAINESPKLLQEQTLESNAQIATLVQSLIQFEKILVKISTKNKEFVVDVVL